MRRHTGFTLLELLVALTIFALISVMAYSGLNSVMAQRAQTSERADQLKQIQMLFNVMERDLSQLVDRTVRNEYGDAVGALVSAGSDDGVEFTRLGYANPGGLPRSDIQRVRYRLEDGDLKRETWWVLDRAPDSAIVEQPLLDHVQEFTLRFLDQTNEWRETWPPTGAGVVGPVGLPRAVEISVETDQFGKLLWLTRLAGSAAFFLQNQEQQGDPHDDDH